MMSDADRIQHVLDTIARIKGFVAGMDQVDFLGNLAVQDAVAYNITVIGEATRCITDVFKSAHPEIPWRQIQAMRNILVHDYLRTDVEQLWLVTKTDLDDLSQKLMEAKDSTLANSATPADRFDD